jgi:hypothetical protein
LALVTPPAGGTEVRTGDAGALGDWTGTELVEVGVTVVVVVDGETDGDEDGADDGDGLVVLVVLWF